MFTLDVIAVGELPTQFVSDNKMKTILISSLRLIHT